MEVEKAQKYSGEARYVLETDHGYYSDYGWGFATSSVDLEEGKIQFEHWSKTSGNYRLIDGQTGEILMTTTAVGE
ncbi:MAG: hypothetical protein RPR40_13745 [Bermanella sp.]